MSRIIDFPDGFSSASAPTTGEIEATSYAKFANDAAFEAEHGAGANGDAYYNTTDNKVRIYENGAWIENASFEP